MSVNMSTMAKPVQRKGGMWHSLIYGSAHVVFRLVSLALSAASAWAIYWFFDAFGNGLMQRVVTVMTAVSFIALGYYVTRGLAYRLATKLRKRSYIAIGVLYLFVEVSCNAAHAAASYPGIAWVHGLQGIAALVFPYIVPVVLSIIPLFNLALAQIDVDLMAEQGIVPKAAMAMPKAAPAFSGLGKMPVPQPQAGYGGNTAAQAGGGGNALKQWWGSRSAQAAPAMAPVTPQAVGSTNGMNGMGIP